MTSELRLHTLGTALLDTRGREVWLRGVNAGGRSKFPPYFPFDGVGEAFEQARDTYLDRLVDWGVNVVRLPFSWEAVEPHRGHYDERFLARYKSLAMGCGARGIRVIVDFHQDVFARSYAGDGFPRWACPTPPQMEPSWDIHPWYLGYLLHPDVGRAFTRFWHNADGLRDAFKAMWTHVARELWEVDAVIGFEIINEPFWGGLPPRAWGREVLPAFYDEMTSAIRSVAPGALIFLDLSGFDGVLGWVNLRRPRGEGYVFAPHFYGPGLMIHRRCLSDADIHQGLARWADVGLRWQMPVLVGEFGISPDVQGAAAHVQAHFDAFDAHHLHGTLWEYSTSQDDWNHENLSLCDAQGRERATIPALIRPYPEAIAGEVVSFDYDAHNRRARLVYDASPGISLIRAPRRCYSVGAQITTQPSGLEVEQVGEQVRVTTHKSDRVEVSLR